MARGVVAQAKRQEEWEIEENFHTLARAAEIKSDKNMMAKIKKLAPKMIAKEEINQKKQRVRLSAMKRLKK